MKALARMGCLLLLLWGFALAGGISAQAQGGLGISGNFYRQEFTLPQGSGPTSGEVFVLVLNNTGSEIRVKMTPTTPLGVRLILDAEEFVLQAGESKRVQVAVEVGSDAVPGTYELGLRAEAQKRDASGIQILGAAAQRAKLIITGQSAQVRLQAVSPSGDPMPITVKLYRQEGQDLYEQGSSEGGILEIRVAPGAYVASAHFEGKKLAEERFSVADGEKKVISLPVQTVYIEGFGAVPNYRAQTKELAFVQVVYTVNNVYQAFPEAKLTLKVGHEGRALDQVVVANMAPWEKGRVGSSYSYVPAMGWKAGRYSFQLVLEAQNRVFALSREAEVVVEAKGTGLSWWAWAGMILAIGGMLILGVFFWRRRGRRA